LLYANLSSNTETYTFNPAKVTGYTAGNTTATLTINDNVYLYSNSISTPALTVSGWNANDTIYIINKGYIMGRGGDGGAYGGELGTVAATNGGTAVSLSSNTTIFNYNFIAGGGGGGAAANRSTSGGGGGGAGGGYGGSTFGGGVGSGSTTPATLNFGTISIGAFETNPTGDIIIRSVGFSATTFGLNNTTTGRANNAFISVFGTKITCRDRTGDQVITNQIKWKPPQVATAGDIPISSRGINVVVLNPQNSVVESAVCYDTWNDSNTKDSDALLIDLQNLPTGKIVLMEVLDAAAMTTAVKNFLTNNFGAPASTPSTWGGQRRAFVFMGIKGGQPNSAMFVVTAEGADAMITATASVTGGTASGSAAAGGAGGAIGLQGSSGNIATTDSGSVYGSGGGGGRIVNGTGGQGGRPGVDVRGFGGGTGGGGGGADVLPAQAIGGDGGSVDAIGGNANPVATTDGGGGGGGWGASGGVGSITPAVDVVVVGLGGKAIEKNGKQLIIAAPGTLYGVVV
jgi:hypothetical protein